MGDGSGRGARRAVVAVSICIGRQLAQKSQCFFELGVMAVVFEGAHQLVEARHHKERQDRREQDAADDGDRHAGR